MITMNIDTAIELCQKLKEAISLAGSITHHADCLCLDKQGEELHIIIPTHARVELDNIRVMIDLDLHAAGIQRTSLLAGMKLAINQRWRRGIDLNIMREIIRDTGQAYLEQEKIYRFTVDHFPLDEKDANPGRRFELKIWFSPVVDDTGIVEVFWGPE